jgi:hypothetical protein
MAEFGDEIGPFGFCKERTSSTAAYSVAMAMLEEYHKVIKFSINPVWPKNDAFAIISKYWLCGLKKTDFKRSI